MLDVSEATKALLKTDSVYKEMYVMIENSGSPYIFENEDIYYEAFELKESILDGSDMTFMGCIASEMRITIRNRDNLKDYALNNRKITVEMTPYDRENTKNHLQSLYSAGDELEFNNVKMVVGDDLSLALTRSANADTIINVCDFMVDEDVTWLLSGCPNGSAITNRLYGRLTVTNPTTGVQTVYNDMGSDVTVNVSRGNIIQYDIIIASGQSTGVTFYPMLRDTDASSEYEGYGTKLIEMDTIPLFTGYIDNGEYDKDKSWLKLTAYDVLSKLNSFNVWNWYNKVAFVKNGSEDQDVDNKGQIGLDKLLKRFADYVNTNSGYEFSLSERCPVILSDVKIKKRLKNKEMTATNFLKSFCQLACACALINREGELQLIYRNAETTELDVISYYRSLTAKDYVVQPFAEGITIRTNSDDDGVTVVNPTEDVETMPTASASNLGRAYHYIGTTTSDYTNGCWYVCELKSGNYTWTETDLDDDENDNYIVDEDDEYLYPGRYYIENNGLVTKLSKNKRKAILNMDLRAVKSNYYTFKSYNLECNGLPYIECGDDVKCTGEADPEEHTNEPFSSSKLTIDNSEGIETPISFEITFTTMYVPLNNYQAYMGSPVCMGSNTGYNDHLQHPGYFGVDMGKCLQLIGKTNASDTIIGDKIVLSNYNGVSVMLYKSLEDGEYVDYDVSSCVFTQSSGGTTTYFDHDLYIPADSEIIFDKYTLGGPFDQTIIVTYTLTKTEVKIQVPVVNRTLKGIQAMVDTFSFELPDTFQKFGGTTSKQEDSNIAKETNTAGEKMSGEEVMIVVSFDSQTGILETSSKVI